MTPPVALLHVGEPVERVRERRADPRQQHELVDDQRRLAAPALRRLADRADHVAQMHVDLARARRRAEQLDATTAVDEVEEHELAHVAPREHSAGQPACLATLGLVLERVRLGSDGCDLVAVGEPLWQRPPHGRLTIAQAFGPSSGVRPCRTTANPCDS